MCQNLMKQNRFYEFYEQKLQIKSNEMVEVVHETGERYIEVHMTLHVTVHVCQGLCDCTHDAVC